MRRSDPVSSSTATQPSGTSSTACAVSGARVHDDAGAGAAARAPTAGAGAGSQTPGHEDALFGDGGALDGDRTNTTKAGAAAGAASGQLPDDLDELLGLGGGAEPPSTAGAAGATLPQPAVTQPQAGPAPDLGGNDDDDLDFLLGL